MEDGEPNEAEVNEAEDHDLYTNEILHERKHKRNYHLICVVVS